MTDREMIEALRNYAKEYTKGERYSFNPGLALMIANRIEQLIALIEKVQSEADINQRMELNQDDRKDK